MPEQSCPNCSKSYQAGDEVCRYCGFVFPFSTTILSSGTVLQGRYEIQELIHTGGMGYVYLAKDKRLYDRLCIIKQVREKIQSESHQRKLEEEALRMAKLNHPNIANIFDHFVEGGYYFLVVERINGKTLSEVSRERQGQLTEAEVVKWAIAICDVVSYIHQAGIIHRDISPDNIMLTDDGSIKFIDFGTLREFRYVASGGTAGMGKYGYAPPEQWQGRPEPRSDIFALGATIYNLLTGFLPLSKTYQTTGSPQREDLYPQYPPIRTKNPNISIQLDAILQKALQLDINSRFSSALEMKQALKSLDKEITQPRVQPATQPKKPARSRGLILAAIIVPILTIIGIITFFLLPKPAANSTETSTHIVYQVDLSSTNSNNQSTTLDDIRAAITSRIQILGIDNSIVQSQSPDRIEVDLPGIQDIDEARIIIGQLALIEFGELTSDSNDSSIKWKNSLGNWKPATGTLNGQQVELNSSFFLNNTKVTADNNGRILLQFEWNSDGAKLSEEITSRLLNNNHARLGIFSGKGALNGEDGLPIAPSVNGIISANGEIEGLKKAEADQLSKFLNTQRIVVPLSLIAYEVRGTSNSSSTTPVITNPTQTSSTSTSTIAVISTNNPTTNLVSNPPTADTPQTAIHSTSLPKESSTPITNSIPTSTPTSLMSGLVGWWSGERNTNDDLDINNGNLLGGLKFGPGKVGKGFLFDADGQGVKIPSSPSLTIRNDITFSAWINPSSLGIMPIIEYDTSGEGSGGLGIHFWIYPDSKTLFVNLINTNGTLCEVDAPGTIQMNQFQHVVMTYSQSTEIAKLYVNGSVVKQQQVGRISLATNGSVNIGYRDASVSLQFATFRGVIDEVSIYNRALSDDEIKAIYDFGSTGKPISTSTP